MATHQPPPLTPTTAGSFPSIDSFLDLDLIGQQDAFTIAQNAAANGPVMVEGEADTEGMSFADMFRHYLAPEVAKLPSSFTLPPLPPSASDHPFAADAPENSFSSTFSPSAFLPTLPGSPIGGFSPVSDNSGSMRSPLSFDLDLPGDSDMGDSWSIDPSFFDPAPGASVEPELPAVVEEEPVVEVQVKEEIEVHAFIPPASVSASIAEEDEDDEMGDSDNSVASSAIAGTKRKTKVPKTSVAGFATATLHQTSLRSTLPPVPEWTDKPDPETYKNLNSKEKRQLRNKISARNFRHRRKEYLTTLEDEISSRDTIIAQLRDEVGTMRGENKELKSEVSLLKAKWDEMMEKMASFPVPAAVGLGVNPANAVAGASDEWALDDKAPAASTSARRTGTRGANGIAKPNLQKDVAPSLKRGTGSWTTQGMGGGYMPVHTTMLPDFNLLNPKPSPFSTQNFNPALNNLSPCQLSQLPSLTAHLRTGFNAPADAPPSKGTFDDFFASNPYWLRPENVEEYRGQLYGKMAHNMAGAASHKTNPSSVPNGFRPAFFAPSSSPRSLFNPSLSAKESRDTYTSPSALLAFQSPRASEQQEAFVAGLAAQTLFSRMTGAFIDAFAGTAEEKKSGRMNGDKVASVLEGRATLQVVMNDKSAVDVGGLGLQMGGLALGEVKQCSFENVCRRWTSKKAEERPASPSV